MNITDHFTLEEMTRSQTATRHNIDNTPGAIEAINLVYTCQTLELIRDVCGGNFVAVSSGYRCLELNRKIGSNDDSAHVPGLASDFTIPGFGSVIEVMRQIVAWEIPFKTLIDEFGRWIHVTCWERNNGGQGKILQARKRKVNGKFKTVYSRIEL